MTKVILWERADGAISIGYCAPGKEARMIEQFEKSFTAKGAKRLPDCDVNALPPREFRDAFRANPDGTIRVDAAVKAKILEQRAKFAVARAQSTPTASL